VQEPLRHSATCTLLINPRQTPPPLLNVVSEEIYVSGFLKSYNELKAAPPVGGMP